MDENGRPVNRTDLILSGLLLAVTIAFVVGICLDDNSFWRLSLGAILIGIRSYMTVSVFTEYYSYSKLAKEEVSC